MGAEAEVVNRRSKRSLKTREAILDAAARVLADHGYEGTSLELVALEAGVTKGTIYYHFDAKESIYAGVVLRYLEGALEKLNAAVARNLTIAAALEEIVDDQVDDTLSPSRRYVHYQEILRLGADVHRTVRAAQRRYEYGLADIIARGQQEGSLMAGDPRLLAMMVIGSLGRTARWYSPGGRVPEPEFRALLKRFVFRGLFATPSGAGPVTRP
jgi:AcrR family transcriptional regulator